MADLDELVKQVEAAASEGVAALKTQLSVVEKAALAWLDSVRPELDRAKLMYDEQHAAIWAEAKSRAAGFMAMFAVAHPPCSVCGANMPPVPPAAAPEPMPTNPEPTAADSSQPTVGPAETGSVEPAVEGFSPPASNSPE